MIQLLPAIHQQLIHLILPKPQQVIQVKILTLRLKKVNLEN